MASSSLSPPVASGKTAQIAVHSTPANKDIAFAVLKNRLETLYKLAWVMFLQWLWASIHPIGPRF